MLGHGGTPDKEIIWRRPNSVSGYGRRVHMQTTAEEGLLMVEIFHFQTGMCCELFLVEHGLV